MRFIAPPEFLLFVYVHSDAMPIYATKTVVVPMTKCHGERSFVSCLWTVRGHSTDAREKCTPNISPNVYTKDAHNRRTSVHPQFGHTQGIVPGTRQASVRWCGHWDTLKVS